MSHIISNGLGCEGDAACVACGPMQVGGMRTGDVNWGMGDAGFDVCDATTGVCKSASDALNQPQLDLLSYWNQLQNSLLASGNSSSASSTSSTPTLIWALAGGALFLAMIIGKK